MKTIFILTNTSDFHSDLLVRAASEQGFRCLRWNTDHERIHGGVQSALPNDLCFQTAREEVWASDIDIAFIRRPSRGVRETDHGWQAKISAKEWQVVEEGLVHLSHAKVINPMAPMVAARNKIFQLKMAKACGLTIPDTLVSTDLDRLITFAEMGEVVTKAIGLGAANDGDFVRTGFTRSVTVDEIRALAAVSVPTLLQRRIRPAAMWRFVTIGDDVFSFRLFGQELEDVDDSRFVETSLSGEHVPCPPELAAGLQEMSRRLGISYASSDFIEDLDGRLFFVDLNPEGQWAYYELEFGVPLSTHLVAL